VANLQPIEHPVALTRGVEIWLLHEPVGRLTGNKYYKLRDNLIAAQTQRKLSVMSFGGAWSNHILALAHATQRAGLGSIGLIRGDAGVASNATLVDAQSAGMQLRFLSREEYRQRNDPEYLQQLQRDHPHSMILPEGGSNLCAITSCADMLISLQPEFLRSIDIVAAAVGTGATLTGLRSALVNGQQVRGYCVVRDSGRQKRMEYWWQQLCAATPSTQSPERSLTAQADCVLVDAVAPGYAKLNSDHWQWVLWFAQHYGIWLDPLYTVKMVASVFSELETGSFKPGTRLLLVHTGGWQGWRGFANRVDSHNELVATINRYYADAVQEPL